MNKDLFEKALKDNYPNSATDFDLDAAWVALEARRKKPKRRAAFWYFAGAMLLLSGLAGWWWQANSHKPVLAHSAVAPPRSMDNATIANENKNVSPVSPAHAPNETPASVTTSKAIQQLTTAYSLPLLKNETTDVAQSPANTAMLHAMVIPHAAPANQHAMAMETPVASKTLAERDLVAVLETLPQVFPAIFPKTTAAPAPNPWPVDFIERKKKKTKTPHWWLGAQATYGFNLVKRQGTASYVDARAMDELPLDLIQAGLNIRRGLKRNWFVETGLQYAQWTDVRRYSAQEEHTETAPNLLLLQVIQANGVVEDFYGPGTVIVRQQVTSENYNRYQYVELPLLAGKAFSLGTHWTLDLSAGGTIGLGARYSGTVTIGSDALPLSDLSYRKAGALSAEARMSMLYKTKIGAIGLSVSGRTGINSLTKSGGVFEEKRSSLGVGILVLRGF